MTQTLLHPYTGVRSLPVERQVLASLLAFLFLILCTAYARAEAALAPGQFQVHPVIDLRNAGWDEAEVFPLDGLWTFYWKQLLSPEDLASEEKLSLGGESFQVPGLWNDPSRAGHDYPVQGYGTFHTRVLVPKKSELYLHIPDMPSAYRLWINGREVSANGQVATQPDAERPAFKTRVVMLQDMNTVLDIVVQVSNFHYKEGGIWHSFILTDETGRERLTDIPIILNTFIFTILLSIGLYQLSIFYMRRQERASLYFGLFCVFLAFRALAVGQLLFAHSSWFDWSLSQRAEHISFFCSLPMFVAFFHALFPQDVNERLVKMTFVMAGLFSFAALVTPVAVFTRLAAPYQVIIVLSVVGCCYGLVGAWRQKRPGARLMGVSTAIFSLAILHDILLAHFVLSGSAWAPLAFIAFVIAQGILLNRRYVSSLTLVEAMSSELKQRNEELEQMDAFKDEFLATTSHELKMPLHGINGLANSLLAETRPLLDDSQRHNLALISSTAKRLGTLVDDILDYSALKHGKLELSLEPVNLHLYAKTVLDTLEPLVGDKDLVLSLDLEAGTDYVICDPNRLQQVLFNLVGNAIKFTEEGSVQLIARLKQSWVEIEVSDTGVGIPRDRQGEVFNPFETLGVRSQSSYTGTGLGLPITRKLVEMQNGQLSLESQENSGTTIRFTLPLASAAPALRPDEPEGKSAASALSLSAGRAAYTPERSVTPSQDPEVKMPLGTLYVVDDEETNRQLLKQQLQAAGFEVMTFAGGASVLERLNESTPDLILLDLMMPGMNGFEVCERIRRNHDRLSLPIVMLTARHQSQDIVQALGLGANDYLTKPYHEKELVARMSSLLAVRQFWLASVENERLQQEISARMKAETELLQANQRLLSVLNQTEEAVCLIDEYLSLIYANRAFFILVGVLDNIPGVGEGALLSEQRIFELSSQLVIRDVFDEATLEELQSCLYGERNDTFTSCHILPVGGGGTPIRRSMLAKVIQDGEAVFLAVTVVPQSSMREDALSIISGISNELSASRARIDSLENALQSVTRYIHSEQSGLALEQEMDADEESVYQAANTQEESHAPEEERGAAHEEVKAELKDRQLLVSLLQFSLDLWERYAKKGKIELAEESRCWRVYLDGGTMKTRTLDKYLTEKSLPDKPRWRSVVRTANFVLSSCALKSEDESALCALMNDVQKRFT